MPIKEEVARELKKVETTKREIALLIKASAAMIDARSGACDDIEDEDPWFDSVIFDIKKMHEKLLVSLKGHEDHLAEARASCRHEKTRYVGMDAEKNTLHRCEDCGHETVVSGATTR